MSNDFMDKFNVYLKRGQYDEAMKVEKEMLENIRKDFNEQIANAYKHQNKDVTVLDNWDDFTEEC